LACQLFEFKSLATDSFYDFGYMLKAMSICAWTHALYKTTHGYVCYFKAISFSLLAYTLSAVSYGDALYIYAAMHAI
jgi:hypothetical protein